MAKYKLVWPKRVEKDGLHYAGDIVDLSHYTAAERERLIKENQYVLVEEPKKAVK